jgi:tRNA(fMet)-specific endonuclease VapC
MTYMLDTNACIRYLNGRAPAIKDMLESLTPEDVIVCAVIKAELLHGAKRSQNPERSLERQRDFLRPLASLPFDDDAATAYAHIRVDITAKGTPIGPNDSLIAAIAAANDVTLVSHSVREFGRVPALKIDDWQGESPRVMPHVKD